MDLRSYSNKGIQILALSGRFDVSTVVPVREWIDGIVTKEPPLLVVNLEEVDFMDSTGLSTLVHGKKQSREKGGDLYLCNLQQSVRIIFELTRLAQYFDIYMGEDEAVAAFTEKDFI